MARNKKFGFCDMKCVCNTQSFHTWNNILYRCYYSTKNRDASYNQCEVCDEWMLFSNFKRWFEDKCNGYIEGHDIDKDILVKGNKIYSPDTCCFLPPEINKCFIRQKRSKNNLPIGVAKHSSGRYYSRVTIHGNLKHLGMFDTPLEAFNAYKIAKEQYIKELAEKYFQEGKITKKVYNALIKYEVGIYD